LVDDNLLSVLMDSCKPVFHLVPGFSNMKPADLLLNSAKLVIAAGLKMTEQARQEMAEEDLGGGIFDDDVANMRGGAARCSLPQQYTTEERETLDKQLAAFNTPGREPKKFRTGTKLYQAQLSDDGRVATVGVQAEVRAPPEQIVSFYTGNVKQFNAFMENITSSARTAATYREKDSDHSATFRAVFSVPAPFSDREVVMRTLWEKLDDNTFFLTQTSVEDEAFPRSERFVRMHVERMFQLTRISPKLTRLELRATASFGGSIPRSVSNSLSRPTTAATPLWLTM
jgi:hypothetical protein